MTPVPFNEAQRLEALASYQVLDSGSEAAFDGLTRLAARQFGTPIALVSLVDEARQWFKSRAGLEVGETPREVAFCAHAIMSDAVMVVPDATQDARFDSNPLVTGPMALRFYAGAPLISDGGFRLGTFCLLDREPRAEFDAEAKATLQDFASLAMTLLEARRERHELQQLEDRARRSADAQHDVLSYLAHEIRTPLSAVVGFAEVIETRALGGEISPRYQDYASKIREAGRHLVEVAGKTLSLQHLKTGELALDVQRCALGCLLRKSVEAVQILAADAGVGLTGEDLAEEVSLEADPTLMVQALVNLLTNAVKYTPTGGSVALSVQAGPDGAVDLCVGDSGIGMDQEGLARALLPFGRVAEETGLSIEGLGLGLPITKQLIELHGGQLLIETAKGQGTRAVLRLPAYRVAAGQVPVPAAPSSQQVA